MNPLRCGAVVGSSRFAEIRRRMIFEFCKWDPQVEDVSTLCPFPLLLEQCDWLQLQTWAELLHAETLALEAALLRQPKLILQLGVRRSIAKLFQQNYRPEATVTGPRVMRFDFHWTTSGWQISEVNSDVPGGYIEAAAFTKLMQDEFPGLTVSGDPASQLASALQQRGCQKIGLVHATAYSDDRQVMLYLGQRLQEVGIAARLIGPQDVRWSREGVFAQVAGQAERVDGLFRFFPGEWLPNLGRSGDWQAFFRESRLPLCNPGISLLSQSKRLPLLWDQLGVGVPTWRALLPETRDPRTVSWQQSDAWVVKPAHGRVGEFVGLAGVTTPREWQQIRRSIWWWPAHWVAQRRFEIVPLTPAVDFGGSSVYPVIGVYTVDGLAAGIYARLAPRPLINHLAQDAAVLVTTASPVASGSEFPETHRAALQTAGSFQDGL